MSEVFKKLNGINVNDRTEKKKAGKSQLTYLSWAWAWAETCKAFPDANYEVIHYDGRPYLCDDHLGYLVATNVTIDGVTKTMSLPVMDGANKAMKKEPYTYSTKYNGEKTVEAATMFDINKTMMRCLVKNLAMFGLGLYIYAGEDLPDVEMEPIAFIDDAQITVIKSLIEGKGYTVDQALGVWSMSNLGEIQSNNYNDHINNVKSWE